jgi:hypothetical protein
MTIKRNKTFLNQIMDLILFWIQSKGRRCLRYVFDVIISLSCFKYQVISTVTKSSADWDSYKEKEGLEDTLANASKDGYFTSLHYSNSFMYNFEVIVTAQVFDKEGILGSLRLSVI